MDALILSPPSPPTTYQAPFDFGAVTNLDEAGTYFSTDDIPGQALSGCTFEHNSYGQPDARHWAICKELISGQKWIFTCSFFNVSPALEVFEYGFEIIGYKDLGPQDWEVLREHMVDVFKWSLRATTQQKHDDRVQMQLKAYMPAGSESWNNIWTLWRPILSLKQDWRCDASGSKDFFAAKYPKTECWAVWEANLMREPCTLTIYDSLSNC